ncbi:hypothetical protein BR93DRAFT_26701 [Coniochaeta sp. PMI_546]|nr:hypothetical protein BR93DRAFT_26701 [Coniochaeta sp. PMI_546]
MSNAARKAPRPVRMRASCDGCFLAKVKCSKDKPLCSRCITNGNECQYSPSSRAGKPRADSTRAAPTQAHLSMYPTGNTMVYPQQSQMGLSQNFRTPMDAFWSGQFATGNPLYGSPQLGAVGVAPNSSQVPMSSGSVLSGPMLSGSMLSGSMPSGSMPASPMPTWTPDHDQFAMPFDQSNGSVDGQYLPQGHSRSSSYDAITTMGAGNQFQAARDVQQLYDLNQTPLSTPPNNGMVTFPYWLTDEQDVAPAMETCVASPTTESQQPTAFQPVPGSRRMDGPSGTCTCFRTCVLSLDSLHSASTKLAGSTANMIMKLNEKALECCLYMLNCPRCTDLIATDTASVLANIITQISSLYKYLLDHKLQFSEVTVNGFVYTPPHTRDFLAQVLQQGLSTLQTVREVFSEHCMKFQDHLQVRSVLVEMVNNSMSWVDQAFNMPSQALGDEDIKSESVVDLGFRI